jgi:hypothetical protein
LVRSINLRRTQILQSPFNNFVLKTLLVTAFKDFYMSSVPKNPIIIPTGMSPIPRLVLSRGI